MFSYGNKQERMSVAQTCPEYEPRAGKFDMKSRAVSDEQQVVCDECINWNDGTCKIYDDILSSLPERPRIGDKNI